MLEKVKKNEKVREAGCFGGAHFKKHPNISSRLMKYKHVLITGTINISVYRKP